MDSKLFVVIIVVLVSCIGCNSECESTKIGDKFLSVETKAYLSYDVGDTLVFESDYGSSKTFVVTEESDNSRLCIDVTCRPIDPYKPRGCDYYEGESYYYTIRAVEDSIYLHLKAGIEPYEDAKELFYEYVQIGLGLDFDSYFASAIPKVYFMDPVFDVNETSFDSILIDVTTYNAGGTIYNNVSVKEFDEASLVYDKSIGFVAYYVDSIWWRLQ